MSQELISKKTRNEFREFLVGWVVREIEMEFDAADIPCRTDFVPPFSGVRRSLVEQYYASLDFAKWEDVRKLLKVYENILSTTAEHNPQAVESLCKWLRKDGFDYRHGRIVPMAGVHTVAQVKAVAVEFDAEHLAQQVKRMEENIEVDPTLAIGSAKELVETCCKTILEQRGLQADKNLDVAQLVKATLKELNLLPEGIPERARGVETIKRLLSNLGSVVQGLAELRNLYGTGHGKEGKTKGLTPRHARLAVGAASTLTVFLFDTHRQRQASTS